MQAEGISESAGVASSSPDASSAAPVDETGGAPSSSAVEGVLSPFGALGISKVCHVSAAGCLLDLETERERYAWEHEAAGEDTRVVWLHFGANAGASMFELEQMSYNEANFRVPDENGWQPQHQPIDHGQMTSHAFATSLPVSALWTRLQRSHRCKVSQDPGRFICNWIYFASQLRAQVIPRHRRPDVMFIHFPTLGVSDYRKQHVFAKRLMGEIVSYSASENLALHVFCTLTAGGPPEQLRRWWFRLADLYRSHPRAYHNAHHIAALLRLSRQHLPADLPSRLVEWCILFHDAIYFPISKTNEEDSVVLWREFCADVHPEGISQAGVDCVSDWILATKKHMDNLPPADSPLAFFLDFDLSILGAAPADYDEYARSIRHEYQHYSEEDFCKGRIQVLNGFLARKSCFFTPLFQSLYDVSAVENMEREIAALNATLSKLSH